MATAAPLRTLEARGQFLTLAAGHSRRDHTKRAWLDQEAGRQRAGIVAVQLKGNGLVA